MSDAPREEPQKTAGSVSAWTIRIDSDFPLHHEISGEGDAVSGAELCGFAIGAILFALLLAFDVPRVVRYLNPMSITWIAALILLLVGAMRRRVDGAARAMLPVLVFVVAALPVSNAWNDGRGGYFAIAGMLPWSDASNYYQGAVEVRDQGKLDFWNQRRPLNAAINSMKLRVGGSVKGWSAVNAVLLAVALLLAGREVELRLGTAASAVFVGSVSAFGFPYWITTMSETNGLFLGLLSMALLLAAMRLRDSRWMLAGLFVIALALDARPGAVFTLPFLWLWSGFAFGDTIRRRVQIALFAMIVTVSAAAPARVYAAMWGSGGGAAHANFPDVLYGIAVGNKGWQQVYADYPDVAKTVDERQWSAFVRQRALELIRRDPAGFVSSLFSSMLLFIWNMQAITGHSPLLVLFVATLCLLRWRDPMCTLLVCGFAGAILSAPFLIRDGGARVFAATVPLIALTGALAIGLVEVLIVMAVTRQSPAGLRRPNKERTADRFVPALAAGIVCVVLIAPVAFAGRSISTMFPPKAHVGTASIAFVPGRTGEWVDAFPEDALESVRVPRVWAGDVFSDVLRTEIADLPLPEPPFSFGVAVDAHGGIARNTPLTWFVTRSGLHLPRTDRPIVLRGEIRATRRGYRYVEVHDCLVLARDGTTWGRLALTHAMPRGTDARSTSPR